MSSIVEQLKQGIDDAMSPFLENVAPRRIFVIDITDHPNVGDNAIFLGETAFLRRKFPWASIGAVSHRTYAESVDAEIDRADLLFLHGGGNFGDTWPLHHDFRLRIIDRFSHKTMIHFPQSIHFTRAETLGTTQRTIARARNFVLLARDNRSLAFARENFDCAVALCPDMAFALGPLEAPGATLDFSCLLRTDKELLEEKAAEVAGILAAAGKSFAVEDWIENRPGVEKIHGLTLFLIRRGLSPAFVARHGLAAFELYARSRLRFGVSLLARGRTVITDRLHGYILATLIGRPRILFDSVDGKVRAFHDTWLTGDPNVVFLDKAPDLETTLERVRLAA